MHRLLDRELGPRERLRLRVHLRSCGSCDSLYHRLSQQEAWIRRSLGVTEEAAADDDARSTVPAAWFERLREKILDRELRELRQETEQRLPPSRSKGDAREVDQAVGPDVEQAAAANSTHDVRTEFEPIEFEPTEFEPTEQAPDVHPPIVHPPIVHPPIARPAWTVAEAVEDEAPPPSGFSCVLRESTTRPNDGPALAATFPTLGVSWPGEAPAWSRALLRRITHVERWLGAGRCERGAELAELRRRLGAPNPSECELPRPGISQ